MLRVDADVPMPNARFSERATVGVEKFNMKSNNSNNIQKNI